MEPSFGERSVINHRDYLINGRFVASSVINITETEVLTAEGRLIAYDYLVIATGHTDSVPKTRSERLNQYQEGKTHWFSNILPLLWMPNRLPCRKVEASLQYVSDDRIICIRKLGVFTKIPTLIKQVKFSQLNGCILITKWLRFKTIASC